MCAHVCICLSVCMHVSVYMCVCIAVMCVRMHVYGCVCACVHTCMCTCVCMCVSAHMYAGNRELWVCVFAVKTIDRTEYQQISVVESYFLVGSDMAEWVDGVTGFLKGTSEAASF